MRERFAEQLAEIEQQLLGELNGLGWVFESIGRSLLDPAAGASPLPDACRRLRRVSRQVNKQLVAVTARQALVASDLRLVLCLIELAHHASLIANQFELIGDQLDQLDPVARDVQHSARQLPLMAELAGRQLQHAVDVFAARDVQHSARQLSLMAELAGRQLQHAADVFAARDAEYAAEHHDDVLDRINRQVFEATHALDADAADRELALRYVLIARCLERIGDNAVDIGEQTMFLVTAQLQEFSDVSHPTPDRDASAPPR